jgi:condensin complex subunit 1
VAKFVSKLSKQAPKALYLNIGLLLGFFDCESYLLRRALIKILSNIIQKVLIKDDQTDENTTRIYLMTKMKFLELLMKRFLDKSSYCRVKVMKVFVKLTEENMIPRHMYLELFSNVIGRFKDQTVLVRKGSLKLFHQMIIIFGLIFNVNIKDGERFLQRNQI